MIFKNSLFFINVYEINGGPLGMKDILQDSESFPEKH
jgi:hypothetical protein